MILNLFSFYAIFLHELKDCILPNYLVAFYETFE